MGVLLTCIALYQTLQRSHSQAAFSGIGYFIFCLAMVIAVYFLLSFLLYAYLRCMRSYFNIVSLPMKRILTLLTIVAAVLLAQPGLTNFQVLVLLLCGLALYCLNIYSMFRFIRMIRTDAQGVAHIWRTVFIILGMFFFVFAAMFYGCSLYSSAAFNQPLDFLDALYYTVITFATVGFGDIVATAPIVKGLSILCSVTSILCLVIVVNAVLSITLNQPTSDGVRKAKQTEALPMHGEVEQDPDRSDPKEDA